MRFEQTLNERSLSATESTDFMETSSCIGIVCNSGLSSKLQSFLSSGSGDLDGLLGDVKGYVNMGEYDWNPRGASIVNALSSDTRDAGRVNVCFNLIVGMSMFVQAEWKSMIRGKRYFIHDYIKEYYDIEKSVFGEIPYTKANTTDVVICNAPAQVVLKDMERNGAYSLDTEEFVRTANGHKYLQVSLKKDEATAQLGKVTTKVKGLYDVQKTKDAVKYFMNESIISESVWGRLKEFGAKLKPMLMGTLSKLYKKLGGKVDIKYIKQFKREMGINESVLNENYELVDSVLSDPKGALKKVNREIVRLHDMAGKDIPMSVKLLSSPGRMWEEDAYKLVGNYLTLKTVQSMISDYSKLQKNVTIIVGDMFYGGSKLPMWKVFGWFGSKSYHSMGTLQTFVDKKNLPMADIMGIKVSPQQSVYAIYLYLLEDIEANGDKRYVLVRTGTNSKSHPTFVLEGTKRLTIPHSKSLRDYL